LAAASLALLANQAAAALKVVEFGEGSNIMDLLADYEYGIISFYNSE